LLLGQLVYIIKAQYVERNIERILPYTIYKNTNWGENGNQKDCNKMALSDSGIMVN
jgi:hypothetical protein